MPPKTAQKTKEQKLKAALSGGKGRKKKWNKGKVKEKMMNAILFDKPTYDRGMKEIPKTKLITPSVSLCFISYFSHITLSIYWNLSMSIVVCVLCLHNV